MSPDTPQHDLLSRPLPDLTLPDSDGVDFPLRQFVGRKPLVLFFYILNGTPGCTKELRSFSESHDVYERAGVAVAAVNADTVTANHAWAQRLRLPYPLLSDPERVAAEAFGGLRRIGVAGWTVELFKRRTILAGRDGVIAAIWDKVVVRRHAAEVLEAARALERG